MGFSSDWLALREPADHAARDRELLQRAAVAAGPNPVILDLGCGTGSTVRALSPLVSKNVSWRLVDNDSELLELAGAEAGEHASIFSLDLQELDRLPLEGVTLITASALLDLVSKKWLTDLASRIRVPVYFALSYNGMMSWQPEDSRDANMTTAFNSHQRGDKGFGPALGPDSVQTVQEIFTDLGFEVLTAQSPWKLGPGEQTLQRELIRGIAAAASEAGATEVSSWSRHREEVASVSICTIGHGDVLALPKTAPGGAESARG